MAIKIRDKGVLLGKVIFENDIPLENPMNRNLVAEVSMRRPKVFGKGKHKVILLDCGTKNNIIRTLLEMADITLKVVPWNYDVTKEEYDGLFISNGPGDPSIVKETIESISKAYKIGKPIFGICMGHQLMALAAGAKTYKLKYGNRGQNQPCIDTLSNRVFITPQNHGYAVDSTSLPPEWKTYFLNVNDGSNEGIFHSHRPFFSVQFHPEARSGPFDTSFLFHQFFHLVEKFKEGKIFLS